MLVSDGIIHLVIVRAVFNYILNFKASRRDYFALRASA